METYLELVPVFSVVIFSGFGFIWFYGVSTIVDYLMPNPFYTYKQFNF